MPKQDPAIKGNPWLVKPLGDQKYHVPSASSTKFYAVDLLTGICTCDAYKPCWHVSTAELRSRLDVTVANSRRLYFQKRLDELIAEDERLHRLLAEQDSHSLRAQLTGLGDAIGVLVACEVAA